jgi:hypothetical protein
MADEKKSESSASTSDSAPANYSRGENQKNVTQNYRDNWNFIFAKKSAKKTAAKAKSQAKSKAKPAKKKR